MTVQTRWNPFQEMENLQRRLSSVFDLVPGSNNTPRKQDESMTAPDWAPLVDIIEDDNQYLITAELPEVKRNEIKVVVENNTLTISGERKFEKEEKSKKYHRVERAYGSFVRSFTLPDDADANKVNAEFKEGVLKVYVAKSENAKPKQIEVKVN